MERDIEERDHRTQAPGGRVIRKFGTRVAGGGFIMAALAIGGATSIVTAFAHNIVSTQAIPTSAVVGATLQDSAILANTTTDRKVAFFLWAPGSNCTGTPFFVDPGESVSAAQGNGSAPVISASSPATTQVGTYQWTAEILNGTAVESATQCGDANESAIVSTAQPNIATTPSAGGAIGKSISDTASVTGGNNPTGQVQFELFQPSDATCDGEPIDAGTKTLDTHGMATSDSETASAVGTYHWIAIYLGDANNKSASSACSDEPVTIGKAAPTIATEPSDGGQVGTSISDSATVSGGSNPTGTVTFKLYGPGDTDCSGTVLFTSTVNLTSSTVHSGAFSATNTAGTYSWVASYSGDSANKSATSECGAETVVITSTPSPSPTPSSGVQALTTPSTGSDPGLGLGIGGFLILGGPAVILSGLLARKYGRRNNQ
jgi:hypothetical protein